MTFTTRKYSLQAFFITHPVSKMAAVLSLTLMSTDFHNFWQTCSNSKYCFLCNCTTLWNLEL